MPVYRYNGTLRVEAHSSAFWFYLARYKAGSKSWLKLRVRCGVNRRQWSEKPRTRGREHSQAQNKKATLPGRFFRAADPKNNSRLETYTRSTVPVLPNPCQVTLSTLKTGIVCPHSGIEVCHCQCSLKEEGMEGQVSSIAGGYVLVPCAEICRAWAAYRSKKIRLYDLRVWLACHEMIARRCTLQRGRSPRFAEIELHALVGGVGGEHLRNSLKRLAVSGLLSWSEQRIERICATELDDELTRMLSQVVNHRRSVPIPRRILRMLAKDGTRSLIATVFGLLFRCLYVRGRTIRVVGACKASWIAVVFGIDQRNAKAARQTLLALGWLTQHDTAQWYRNRYGIRLEVNTQWGEAVGAGDREVESELPPPVPFSTSDLPPPVPNQKLLVEYKNQKPAQCGPAGACSERRKLGRPTLTNVVEQDLGNSRRLLALFREAVKRRLVGNTDADCLVFFTAAEHARAVGTRNRCGLFVHLVRNKLWHYLTQADEDSARKRLNELRLAANRSGPGAERQTKDLSNKTGLVRISDCLPEALLGSIVSAEQKAA
jgi:hypothetical protein